MIHVILRGDLGDFLFQYALARKLAIKHNTDVEFLLSHYLNKSDWNGRKLKETLSHFKLPVQYKNRLPLAIKLLHTYGINVSTSSAYFKETKWGFNRQILDFPSELYLFGFFQSEKFFKDIDAVIRKDLQLFFEPNDSASIDMENKIRTSESVALHIPRGNYLKSPLQNVCQLEYYKNAIAAFTKKSNQFTFYLFSDDIAWCKAHFTDDNMEFINLNQSKKMGISEFRLMSLCRHQIIANQSFSWWAAWLNVYPKKRILAPCRWYDSEPLNSLAMKHTVPNRWELIDF